MLKTRAQSSSTYLKRRPWTTEDAKQALTALARSGLDLRAFAVREGLDPQRLWRWRRHLAETAAPALEEVVRPDAPLALHAEAPAPALRERFEVVLKSGRGVRVPALFDASALVQLLTVVDEVRPC